MCVNVCVFSCVSFLWYLVCVLPSVWLCACAYARVRPRACERGAVCVCDVAHVDIGKRANACWFVCVCVCVCVYVCALCAHLPKNLTQA